ncbi:MAG: NAD(P)-binding domain-containing protein [Gammaproteobacteria bacterium]|nr:NAD(P)-binding domain-containing protein [Gammaproteobacteria bacterium]
MTQISVIGLGVMGSALANTLLQKGYSVTVWNRTIEKTCWPLMRNVRR